MPRLAAFPKAYMQALCREGSMRVLEWLDLAATLPIEGVEWYAGFLENADPAHWPAFRAAAAARGTASRQVNHGCTARAMEHLRRRCLGCRHLRSVAGAVRG